MASKKQTRQATTLPNNFTAWISDHRVGKVSSFEHAVEQFKKVPADARLQVTQTREGRNHSRRRTRRSLSFSESEILRVLEGPTRSRDFTCPGGGLYLVVPPPKVPAPLRRPGPSLMEALYDSELSLANMLWYSCSECGIHLDRPADSDRWEYCPGCGREIALAQRTLGASGEQSRCERLLDRRIASLANRWNLLGPQPSCSLFGSKRDAFSGAITNYS